MDTSRLRRKITIAILICMCSELSHGIDRINFVDFGSAVPDKLMKSNGGFDQLDLGQDIYFYGLGYGTIYINPDVQITTNDSMFINDNFINSFISQITALKSNMDSTGNGGNIYYRQETLAGVTRDYANSVVSRSLFGAETFNADIVVVVTFDNVRTADDSGRNTFQIVMAAQGKETYVIFNYADIGGVQTYGNSGFASDDGRVHQIHPSTPTALPSDTNVCVPGQYVYKVDGDVSTDTNNCKITECIHGHCCVGLSATCQCDAGWTGTICDQFDKCSIKNCQNGNCFINATGDAECTCESGWTGALCDIDECDANLVPCETGNCIAGSCVCDLGFIGFACDIDLCRRRNCQNQGTCNLVNGKPVCQCKIDFTGVECETDLCDGLKCQNGQCDRNTLKCICDEGWTGNACDTSLSDNCSMGYPSGEGNNVPCICHDGWTGDLCDEDEDECNSSQPPCKNGKCINTIGSFVCKCEFGYDGNLCDKTGSYMLKAASLVSLLINLI